MWRSTLSIPAPGRQREVDACEFKANQGYMAETLFQKGSLTKPTKHSSNKNTEVAKPTEAGTCLEFKATCAIK